MADLVILWERFVGMFGESYRGKRVLVTGHTGFKGSWLCEWLLKLGASVSGYALDPEPEQRLYGQLGLASRLAHDFRGDLGDRAFLAESIRNVAPDFLFHLAAQPLVRRSFDRPVETFQANLMGTVHVMDSLREFARPCVAVIITTDKCYENREWLHGYRETDPMGGYDPYSASKGAAELAIAAYRRSFFSRDDGRIFLASCRAGNVIGGGDWAVDRIVPDCFRSLATGEPVQVRNSKAIRPWQHVLEPLGGYLWLGACLAAAGQPVECPLECLCGAFNFGPRSESHRTVAELVEALLRHTGGEWRDVSDVNAPHEACRLSLAIDKAFHLLHWRPIWDFGATIEKTVDWYSAHARGALAAELTWRQLDEYELSARQAGLRWADLRTEQLFSAVNQ